MSSRIEIAQNELATMNDLQKFMSTADINDDVIVDAMLNDEGFHYLSRFIPFRQKMEPRPIDGEIEFSIPSGIHQLSLSTFTQRLPRVTISEKYAGNHRISWVPKTLIYIIESAQLLKSDGTEIGARLTDRILDLWVEYLAKEFFRNEYKTLIEMIQGQNEWGTTLREKTLSLPQPFFYSTARAQFKRCLVERQNISHRYNCRRDIRKLLILEEFKDDKWVRCPEEEIITKCLFSANGITADGLLSSQPELWGNCVIVNEREHKETIDITLTQNYWTPAQEFIPISVNKILEGEGSEIVRFEHSGCVRGIYWMIENLNAKERGDYYNYATEEGESPITKTAFYHLDNRVWDLESHHHRLVLPAEAGLRTPRKVGYHYQPLCINGALKNTDTSLNLLALQSRLEVKYNMGENTRGRLHVFLDMHRLVSYEDGDIKILRDQAPIISKPTPQPPPVNNRPTIALPQRHR